MGIASPNPHPPDPHRTITPGGFHVTSPWDRQYVAPEPAEKPTPTTKPETVVDMADLEEVNNQLLDLIDQVGQNRSARISAETRIDLVQRLEDIHNLIYRNLR